MAEETAFENAKISNFEGLVTLTLDRVTLHIVVHHLSTFTYMPNIIEIKETFCGHMDVGRDNARTDIGDRLLLGRLCRRVDQKTPN